MKGLYPLMPLGTGNLVVGRAVTVRYLPFREDVDAAVKPEERLNQPYRRAIKSLESADIPVIDATGNLEAGAIGDVLAARIKYCGASAALVDGAVRDGPHIRQVGLPTFMRGAHPSAGPRAIMSMDVNLRIQCGGVLLMPGDMILADDEAAAVAPPGYAEAVATQGLEQEAMELFIRAMIEQGVSIQQTYPPDESVRAEYEAYRLSRSATGSL
ncbi:MAG: hypothetical protein M0Z94_16915 [Dehalococcoidales bacterium]|nr:hypothetical protein [Dehalococcoidales bacterium]